ncbi:MAG: YqgE/AlgH family protein [Alphaproteobacteria bacterium]|nr:YqgE/AlgH family protein [Alphaproteobacteria bacterium]
MKQRRAPRRMLGRLTAFLALAAVLSSSGGAVEQTISKRTDPSASDYLTGWMLVAAPRMRDPRFAKTVILLAHHNNRGAMGLIVNRQITVETAAEVLQRMEGEEKPGKGGRDVRIHYGGPVQPLYWNFLHSSDYRGKGTMVVTRRVSLTRDRDILRALARGEGPAKGFLAVGYAGWGPGQLEGELRRQDWIMVRPDDGIVFDGDMNTKWQRAMDKRGVDL